MNTSTMSTVDINDYIYLDYAASAPLCEEAAEAMAPYQVPGRINLAVGGNANSLYTPGRKAFADLEEARRRIARGLGARRPDEVIFTSGATEADNAAIFGLVAAAIEKRRLRGDTAFVPHIVTTTIEHEAILAPVKSLAAQGVRVSYLSPNRKGFIEPQALEDVMDESVVLVSIQAANSEVGSVFPLSQLAEIAHRYQAVFHTDAVQALGKIEVNVQEWGVDAASFSAHKIGGPKGVGTLYLKARTPFKSQLMGGGQESARRSGTQNVAGVVGFAAALDAVVCLQQKESERLCELRDYLYAHVVDLEGVEPTLLPQEKSIEFLPNIVHILVKSFESETLILRLDKLGIGVSGGSACASHSLEPSHVLRSLGIPTKLARGALRISFGRYTTKEDIDTFLQALKSVVAKG